MSKHIFIQIAAYRDPQLVPTVRDMIEKADHPEEFAFGICWQYGPDDDLTELDFVRESGAELRLQLHHFSESKGLCWARSMTNSLYKDEKLTLQIDSHHRFVRHWDTLMLEDYELAKQQSSKPILSTYLPPFNPREYDSNESRAPTLMSQYRFHKGSGLLGSMPWYIPLNKRGKQIVRTRILSGHFYLTCGRFCKEVPYDPELYFGGEIEEVSMSLRAWTHGYDIWSPTRDTLAWHEYTRDNRPKHWTDHSNWTELEKKSKERFERLCGRQQPPLESFGLGPDRTLEEFKDFTGIDFAACKLQRATLNVDEPPNKTDDEWVIETNEKTGIIMNYVAKWSIPDIESDCAKHDGVRLKMLALGLENDSGESLIRADVEIDLLDSDEKVIAYDGTLKPTKFVLWPMFADGSWGSRQEGPVRLCVC